MYAASAQGRWQQLDGKRQGLIRRCELYALYTLPKICPRDDYHQNSEALNQDYQAVGAQAVNHLSNKMMLALFAPSRPFFRLDASEKAIAAMLQTGMKEPDIAPALAAAEKKAIGQLDRLSLRPKLYELLKHLIITGNVVAHMEEGEPFRVIGIKNYVVRRSLSGRILELIIADKVTLDELDDDVQEYMQGQTGYKKNRKVTLYRCFKFKDGEYHMTQWVDQIQLPEAEFNGKWPEDKLPYRVLTWDLTDGQDYGTGLVEDYENDFAGLSALTKSQIQGAILSSEFRWLVNPAGMTRVEDFMNTANGEALPGVAGDVELVSNSKGSDLQVVMNMSSEYVNRIGRAFLLASVLVRQAERVTAEEIRQTADELETALGGGYSRIAVDLQGHMAAWLLEQIKVEIADNFDVTVVTGLDALSRNGDLEDLKLLLADMAAVSQLPEALQQQIDMPKLFAQLAAPRRVDVAAFMKSPEQIAAEQQQQQELAAQQMAAQAGADIAVNNAAQSGEQQ